MELLFYLHSLANNDDGDVDGQHVWNCQYGKKLHGTVSEEPVDHTFV